MKKTRTTRVKSIVYKSKGNLVNLKKDGNKL